MKKKQTRESEIKKLATDLLGKLKVEAKVEVVKEEDDHYQVNLETEETGLLIGHHGETVNSFQLLLGVILFKKTGEWIHVVVDVGGYRKMREESIKEMVNRIVTEVETSREPVQLPPLTPFERRAVHMMLTDHQTVVSESIGEGRDRRLTIKPK